MAGVNEMAFRLYRVAGRHPAILFVIDLIADVLEFQSHALASAAGGAMQRNCPSAFRHELVADAADGLQKARRVGPVFEIFAQADDEVVDGTSVGLFV